MQAALARLNPVDSCVVSKRALMPYLQLSIDCPATVQAVYEAAFEQIGALAVSLIDADANTCAEQAILEPAPGQTPLWNQVKVIGLFSAERDALDLLAALEAIAPSLGWHRTHFNHVADQVWERVWLDQYSALSFGQRTFIVPWAHPLPAEATRMANPAIIRLDPGLAFGSGTHPTTALCLEWLDALAQRELLDGQDILDVGCGSGILAIAAVKLGAQFALAIDTDPQALEATQNNAERNQVAAALQVTSPQQAPQRSFPYVVANILAATLESLAPRLLSCVAARGSMALSGILRGQEEAVAGHYRPWFHTVTSVYRDEWVRLDLVDRRPDSSALECADPGSDLGNRAPS